MAPLIRIVVPSIYLSGGVPAPLPSRMAQCTPDTKMAIAKATAAVRAKGGRFVLSDLFRSYDMQLGSHMDFVSGKKKAFSPPPGGSLHEGGRAMDIDLKSLKMPLADFWVIAAECGLTPIIAKPLAGTSESWHFSCRGSHAKVYDYYKAGKGTNFDKPYQAMAASAICTVGVKVDKFGDGQDIARIQSGLIRLGQTVGNLDGAIGPKTRDALKALGLDRATLTDSAVALDHALEKAFPEEYFDKTSTAPIFA